jgi:hypothetical protein
VLNFKVAEIAWKAIIDGVSIDTWKERRFYQTGEGTTKGVRVKKSSWKLFHNNHMVVSIAPPEFFPSAFQMSRCLKARLLIPFPHPFVQRTHIHKSLEMYHWHLLGTNIHIHEAALFFWMPGLL